MFLNEEEAARRLTDPRNILTRVPAPSADSALGGLSPVVLDPVSLPTEPEGPISEDPFTPESLTTDPAAAIFNTPPTRAEAFDPIVALKMARIVDSHTPGRKEGIRNRTLEENASIGLTRLLLGEKATGELFGTVGTQPDNLTLGYTGSHDRVEKRNKKEELLDEIYAQGQVVSRRAFNRLLKSIDLLDDSKLDGMKKPTEIIQVAKGLSGIIRDVTPKDGNLPDGGVHFHIYRPEQRTEQEYETLSVNADGSVSFAPQ